MTGQRSCLGPVIRGSASGQDGAGAKRRWRLTRLHLGVFFTGVGPNLLWTEPDFAEHTHIDTFRHVVQTLERGLFDAFFLGEGLRVRENRGTVYDLDVAGRPDAITQLAALAAETTHIGLVATQNTTYNYPADLARRLASLDAVSGGRAGWNIVTTDNAWTGENFRHGGWLPHARRYERATLVRGDGEGVVAQRTRQPSTTIWSPWTPPARSRRARRDGRCCSRPATPTAAGSSPPATPTWSSPPTPTTTRRSPTPPTSARGWPGTAGRRTRCEISRAPPWCSATRPPRREERARWITREQTTGPRAIAFLEQYWGKDLSGYDPDGPLPDIDPADGELDPSRGTIPIELRTGKLERIAGWRKLSAERGLSIRDLVIEVTPRHNAFVGTPGQVADEWTRYVRDRAVDGFNLLPQLLPGTVEDIVDRLVPQLQERGVYRTAYEGTTLREHLELPPL